MSKGLFLNPDVNKALLHAAETGDLETAREALDRDANPNAHDGPSRGRCTPLCWAAMASDPPGRALTGLLLERGANPNLMNDDGHTPLMLAVRGGHWGVARQLLDGGADAALTDKGGRTALDRLRQDGSPEGKEIARRLAEAVTEREQGQGPGSLAAEFRALARRFEALEQRVARIESTDAPVPKPPHGKP